MKSAMTIIKTAAVCCAVLLTVSCESTELRYIDKDERNLNESAEFTYTASDDEPCYFGSQSIDELKYHDGYIYIVCGTPYRLNTETGNVTTVCGDPLCTHDSDECPFFRNSGTGTAYYISADGSLCFPGDSGFVRYDQKKMKRVLLDDYRGAASLFFAPEVYYDDYRIYSGFDYDPEKDKYTYGLRRADLKNGGSEFFGGTTDEDGNYLPLKAQPWFTVGDRLYLEDGKCFFSLDKDGGDRKDLFAKKGGSGYMYTDGEYIYYCEDDRSSIIRRSLDGGEPETVVTGVYSYQYFKLTDEYIYYMKPDGDDVVLGKADIRGYASSEVVITPLVICRSRHDGSGEERLALVTDTEKGFSPLGWIVVGNYLYCKYSYWEDADGDGIFTDGDNKYSTMITSGGAVCRLMRVDLTTGDRYIFSITG